jgi:predicted RND superfamily exporter protein
MISFRTRYDVHNRLARVNFDPGGEPAKVSEEELEAAYFKNPSSRWWCITGFSVAIVGMGMLMVSMAIDGDSMGIFGVVALIYMAFRVYRAATAR